MQHSYPDGLAAQLPVCLRKELAAARGSKLHPLERRGLGSYIGWLQTAIGRVRDGGTETVYDEWMQTRPRCARRAMASTAQSPA